MLLLFIAGILCLVYYVIILAYVGIHAAFAWFWLLSGIVCTGLSFFMNCIFSRGIKVPFPIKAGIFILLLLGLCIFGFVEINILVKSGGKVFSEADYMIVLGAQVKGNTVSRSLEKRLDTAVSYLRENPDTKVIVSGGQGSGEDISEAQAMYDYLIRAGISKAGIIKEEHSTSTYENIKYSRQLINDETAKTVIVTNAFHIYRSVGIAKKQGFTAVEGLGAPTDRILAVSYYVREAMAVIKDKITGNL